MSQSAPIVPSPHLRAVWSAEWGLPAHAMDDLLHRGITRTYSRGSSILPQGAVRNTVFFLLHGEVSISVFLPDGRRILCGLYQPGTIFGFPLVDTERPRWSAADAFTEATLSLVARRDFEEILSRLPAATVMGFFNRILMRQARFAMRLLHCLVLDLPGRLALTLLDLAHTFVEAGDRGTEIRLPITHELLAEMVGASRERVSKAMAEFAAQGWISYRRGQIVLKEPQRLEHAAQPRAMPIAPQA